MSGVIDFNAIAIAIAARFSAAQVTPPTGQPAIRLATEQIPSQLPPTPVVLVFPPADVPFAFRASARTGEAVYRVQFYLDRVQDTARNATLVYKWMSALYGQIDGQIQLGLSSYVNWTEIGNMHPGVLTYAGESYEGIVFDVTVHLGEGVSPSA
jgi:hypothetical protein